MATIDKSAEKRTGTATEQLNFGPKTARRVAWESWSFRIVGPRQVEVTNESYGYLKADHQYTVTVEETDGLAFPAECECKADQYSEEYACKHRVAVAAVGGPTVLNAAARFSPLPETETDDCDCSTLSDGFPCWPCVRNGKREILE